MSSLLRSSLPLLLAASGALAPAVLAQDQSEVVQQRPTIPDDFSLPPGEGETQAPPAQTAPVVQTVPEPSRTPAPSPARSTSPAPRAVAPSVSETPAADEIGPPVSEATPEPAPAVVEAPPPAAQVLPPVESPDESVTGGFNWALLGLLITFVALLALVLFLRRQKVHTVPVRIEPMSPAALPIAEPAPPESVRPVAPPPKPARPAVSNGDGLVHARMPNSGLVTTNLAAKRRAQAEPLIAPKRPVSIPAVTTRISFDGF